MGSFMVLNKPHPGHELCFKRFNEKPDTKKGGGGPKAA